MTKAEAQRALDNRLRVCLLGDPVDTGHIIGIDGAGIAEVAWDSGFRTPAPIADLELATKERGK